MERVDLASKVPTGEHGDIGVPRWGGDIAGSELDYAQAWQLPQRWATQTKMRSNPDVASITAAITLPLLSAPYTVEPGDDAPGVSGQQLADFVEQSLGNMTVTLQRHTREAVACIWSGVQVFEIVVDKSADDGLYHLRKLALRPNNTISHWRLDDTGGPLGITQVTNAGEAKPIDIDKLLIFTYRQEGGDVTGRGVYREMYGPYLLGEQLWRVGAAAVDRHGMGIPTILYKGRSAQIMRQYESLLMGLRSHSKGYALLTDLEDMAQFQIKGVDGTMVDPVPQMEFHRRAMFGAALAGFLTLGSDGGAFALSRDHSSFFLMGLEAAQAEILAVYNSYLIPRLIGYNWAGVPATSLPRIQGARLDRRSVTDWITAASMGVEKGIVQNGADLQRMAHEYLGSPLPEEQAEDAPGDTVEDINAPDDIDPAAGDVGDAPVEAARRQWRGATTFAANDTRLKSVIMLEALGIPVEFRRMAEGMDGARDRIAGRLTPRQEAIAKKVATDMEKLVKRGDAAALADYRIPYDDEAAIIEDELRQVYGLGGDALAAELRAQGIEPKDTDRKEEAAALLLLGASAKSSASSLSERMATAAKYAAITYGFYRLATGGKVDNAAMAAAITAAPTQMLGKMGSSLAVQALGLGRNGVATANAAAVDYYVNTEQMDLNTCIECAEADGRGGQRQAEVSAISPNVRAGHSAGACWFRWSTASARTRGRSRLATRSRQKFRLSGGCRRCASTSAPSASPCCWFGILTSTSKQSC
ncbi:MAG: hypothetical protein IPK80_02965 [Nannocystis sp.]|nr:hypothetical protein [Nannocystis sp.]